MGAGGMLGSFVDAGATMWSGFEEAGAEREAARMQRDREFRAANVAIEGALEKGAFESGRRRMLGSALAARQKQAYAASGVDASSGTAAAVQADTMALSERDAQQASINAAREVYGYKEQKRQAQEDETMRQQNASRKATAGVVGGLSKFLGGAAGGMGSK